jgi:hypothetical protein
MEVASSVSAVEGIFRWSASLKTNFSRRNTIFKENEQ